MYSVYCRLSEQLLKEGADPNEVLPVEGVAPMHIAAGLSSHTTHLLLDYKGNPNVRCLNFVQFHFIEYLILCKRYMFSNCFKVIIVNFCNGQSTLQPYPILNFNYIYKYFETDIKIFSHQKWLIWPHKFCQKCIEIEMQLVCKTGIWDIRNK